MEGPESNKENKRITFVPYFYNWFELWNDKKDRILVKNGQLEESEVDGRLLELAQDFV
jgi:hypothetical protein